jgi:hypothetical protein
VLADRPTGESLEAPDLPDVVVAWRVWRLVAVHGRCRLASAFKWAVWPPQDVLEARCLCSTPRTFLDKLRGRPPHPAPGLECFCGIYGADLSITHSCLAGVGSWELGRALGEVWLWGTVIECERGYRASHAYPRTIYLPADGLNRAPDRLVEDLELYGVPIEMLEVGWVEASEELRRRAAA